MSKWNVKAKNDKGESITFSVTGVAYASQHEAKAAFEKTHGDFTFESAEYVEGHPTPKKELAKK